MSQTKSELEQCFYCREFLSKPVSLHHTIEECKENERIIGSLLSEVMMLEDCVLQRVIAHDSK